MLRMRHLVWVCFALTLPACELFTELSTPPPIVDGSRVERLVITPMTPTVRVNASLPLMVMAFDDQDELVSNPNLSWLSQEPQIATVSATGSVTGVMPGQATIEVTSGGVKATVTVTVTEDNEAQVTQVTLTPEQLTISLMESRQITAEVFSADGKIDAPTITWRSSNPDVVSVTNNGVVRGLVVGQVTITATSGTKSDTTEVSVVDSVADGALSVVVGSAHACALNGRGEAYCWGQGRAQQWGEAFSEQGALALHKVDTTQRFKTLAAGDSHTCGLTVAGAVYCWGRGELGQLGDGQSTNRAKPVKISSELSFVSLSAFADTTCGLDKDSKLYCWGENQSGQLGLDPMTTTASNRPVAVASAYSFEQVSVGRAHVCALTGSEGYCWGDNGSGQLAQMGAMGSTEPMLVRTQGNSRLDLKSIAAGEDVSCGVTINGQTYCWGSGLNRRLGRDNSQPSNSPLLIPGGHSFERISIGEYHSCGIKLDGQVWCWGNNEFGVFARKPLALQPLPARIGGNLLFDQVAVHGTFACGVDRGGDLYCWGDRGQHYLANGEYGFATQPQRLPSLVASQLSLGWRHACAISDAGALKCWGRGSEGQLGATEDNEVLAAMAKIPEGVTETSAVATGRNFSCAVSTSGRVSCWGANGAGQLGTGNRFDSTPPKPIQAAEALNFEQVVAGELHACAITSPEGHLYCWGLNDQGQVGDGSTNPQGQPRPTRVAMLEGVKSVSLGADHTCAILVDDSVSCWGGNLDGQLGLGVAGDAMSLSLVPVAVSNLSAARSVSAGPYYTCAVENNGGVKCWGLNSFGRLGVAAPQSSTPTKVELPAQAAQVALGLDSTCARTNAGEVYCWGYGLLGQLGGLSFVESSPPVKVEGVTNATALELSASVACVIDDMGAVMCWGRELQGQIEANAIGIVTTPTAVTLEL